MRTFLIIQTAFIGDVILATALIEQIAAAYPEAQIDFLLRAGNESLLANNPHISEVIVWEKRKAKYSNLFKTISKVRRKKYDVVINLQRFAASGIVTMFSGAEKRIGFKKNPFSFIYSNSVEHEIGNGLHEVERNNKLLDSIGVSGNKGPKLYPAGSDEHTIKEIVYDPYVVMAPASVWFTKQLPANKWIELIRTIPKNHHIYFVGAPGDRELCEKIIADNRLPSLVNLCGELSFLQTAALMKGSKMNYVNDSAPLHIASAMDAPVTAIFCSTVPSFGFGPLSKESFILETSEDLNCRPCGVHGLSACPKGHFKCAQSIVMQNMLKNDE